MVGTVFHVKYSGAKRKRKSKSESLKSKLMSAHWRGEKSMQKVGIVLPTHDMLMLSRCRFGYSFNLKLDFKFNINLRFENYSSSLKRMKLSGKKELQCQYKTFHGCQSIRWCFICEFSYLLTQDIKHQQRRLYKKKKNS